MKKCVDPLVSRKLVLDGKNYTLNDRNYLKDFTDWDARIREWLASEEKISLEAEHLHVIDFLRDYYAEKHRHPVIRLLTAAMAQRYGPEKGSIRYFHILFPGGVHQAYLLAGLPMQDSCC